MKTVLGKLEFTIAREIVIRAPRATVFRTFTDSERWARWWGAGSTVDGRVGGKLAIVYPDGTSASGEVLVLEPPERIVFSYGYDGAGKTIAPGGSRVTIRLAEHPQGTRLSFLHEVADAATRDHHVQGWRYQLALFANAVANEVHAPSAAALADVWFAAWNQEDSHVRERILAGLVAPDVEFQDAHSCTSGADDLSAHIAGARVHMRGIMLERTAEPRQCQGTVLVDWVAKRPDGQILARGTNLLELTAEGRIARVVGFWGKP